MPIHSIRRTNTGNWAIIFREGGNALYYAEGSFYEGPVNADGSIDGDPETDALIYVESEEETFKAAFILRIFVKGLAEKDFRKRYAKYLARQAAERLNDVLAT